MAIQSFKCKDTHNFFEGKLVARFTNLASVLERKLQLLDSAATLDFLKSPPGNHLEALKKDRIGQHSIRINGQFRICFVWTTAGPEQVEVTDYH